MTQESGDNLTFPFAVDILIYGQNEQLKAEYLELNYRKTMGLLLTRLKSQLSPNAVGKLSITKRGLKLENTIKLSPENKFLGLYFNPNWPGA